MTDKDLRRLSRGELLEMLIAQTAEAAAQQYLENIRTLSSRQEQVCKQREEEGARKVNALLAETKSKCAKMTKEAEDAADRTWSEAQAKIQKLIDDQAGLWEFWAVVTRNSNES